jgi:hypothetical protein
MGSFYDEIEATRARNDEALAAYERTCMAHAARLRGQLQQQLGWPDAQMTLVDFDEPPAGSRRVMTPGVGHVSRDGYHFGLQVAGPVDWHIVFYWTMRISPSHASRTIELEGDPDEPRRLFVVELDAANATEPLADYMREKIRAFVRRFTLAALVETGAGEASR